FGRSNAPDAPAEPLLRFRYLVPPANDLGSRRLVYDYPAPDVYGFGPAGGSELVDVDGDGLNDILRYAPREGASFPSFGDADLTTPSAFEPGAKLTLTKIDRGIATTVVPHFDQTAQSTEAFLYGDFDGDGRQDLVQALPGATANTSLLAFFPGRANR